MPTRKKRPSGLQRSLRLQHHRHSGRVLHHAHTSYRGVGLLLGFAFIFVIGLGIEARVTADTLHVYATVPAQIPTDAAVITSPQSGSIDLAVFTLSGTCPALATPVIIAIEADGVLQGSVVCSPSGTFSMQMVAIRGITTYIAKIYTITGDSGPDSLPVYVSYEPRHDAGGVIPAGDKASLHPLIVNLTQPFIVFGPGKEGVLEFAVSGGTGVYRVHIEWGDGSSEDHDTTSGAQQSYPHHYIQMTPQVIRLTVRDTENRLRMLELVAVTPFRGLAGIGSTDATFGNYNNGFLEYLGLYGAYLMLLAAFGYLWVKRHTFAYAKVPPHRPRPFLQRYNHSFTAVKPPAKRKKAKRK